MRSIAIIFEIFALLLAASHSQEITKAIKQETTHLELHESHETEEVTKESSMSSLKSIPASTQSPNDVLSKLIGLLDGQEAVVAAKILNILSLMRSEVDTVTHSDNPVEKYRAFNAALLHFYKIIPFLKVGEKSPLSDAGVAQLIGYYAVMSDKTMHPPDAYEVLCKNRLNYRETTTKNFTAIAEEVIQAAIAKDALTPEAYATQFSDELKGAITGVTLVQIERLITYIRYVGQDREAMKAIAEELKLNEIVVERYFVYTSVFFRLLPLAIKGKINVLGYLSMTCTNYGYNVYTDKHAKSAASGESYYNYIKELYKLSGTKTVSTLSASIIGLSYLYLIAKA